MVAILSISFLDMLSEMEKTNPEGLPIPFDVVAISFDKRFKENRGRVLSFNQAVLARNMKSIPKSQSQEPKITARNQIKDVRLRSAIRRLWIAKESKIKNVYIRLITHFNSKMVIY